MFARLLVTAAVSALAAGPVAAQDAAESSNTREAADGSVVHIPSGAICPSALAGLARSDVHEADIEGEHVGIVCEYKGEDFRAFSLFFTNLNHPIMTGLDDIGARWQATVDSVVNQFPDARPIDIGGLGADEERGVNGMLFETTIQNAPVQVGVWQTEAENWVVKARATFAPTLAGWQAAATARAVVGDNASIIEAYTPLDDAAPAAEDGDAE